MNIESLFSDILGNDSDSYWNVSDDGEDSIEVEPSLDRLLMEQELV